MLLHIFPDTSQPPCSIKSYSAQYGLQGTLILWHLILWDISLLGCTLQSRALLLLIKVSVNLWTVLWLGKESHDCNSHIYNVFKRFWDEMIWRVLMKYSNSQQGQLNIPRQWIKTSCSCLEWKETIHTRWLFGSSCSFSTSPHFVLPGLSYIHHSSSMQPRDRVQPRGIAKPVQNKGRSVAWTPAQLVLIASRW